MNSQCFWLLLKEMIQFWLPKISWMEPENEVSWKGGSLLNNKQIMFKKDFMIHDPCLAFTWPLLTWMAKRGLCWWWWTAIFFRDTNVYQEGPPPPAWRANLAECFFAYTNQRPVQLQWRKPRALSHREICLCFFKHGTAFIDWNGVVKGCCGILFFGWPTAMGGGTSQAITSLVFLCHKDANSIERWKKSWLVRVYRGLQYPVISWLNSLFLQNGPSFFIRGI